MTIEAYPCPDCKGTGNDPYEPWRPCTWCHGNAVMYRDVVPHYAQPEVQDESPGHDLTEKPRAE